MIAVRRLVRELCCESELVGGLKMKLRLIYSLVVTFALLATLCMFAMPVGAQSGKGETLKALPKLGPPPRTADGHPDLSGVWFSNLIGREAVTEGVPRALREYDPKTEDAPPFQPWAAAKIKVSDVEAELGRASVNCLPRGVPGMFLLNAYPIQLIQTPALLAQLDELNNNFRVIPLDGHAHSKDPDPQFNGEGIGHWEGDTLVIDTIGIDERTWNNRTGWFHSDQEHVIERLTRPDINYLDYQVTIEDPKVLTRPWTSAVRHLSLGHEPLLEYYCTHNEEVSEYKALDEQQKKAHQFSKPERDIYRDK
jgi:hypothetical protein